MKRALDGPRGSKFCKRGSPGPPGIRANVAVGSFLCSLRGMKRIVIRIALVLVALLVVAQLVPVDRRNPPVTARAPAPPDVEAVLRRACFDCHSNETVWPPQAYVAPFSWLVAHDVKEGREELNFSEWTPKGAQKASKKLAKEVAKGDMPPFVYVIAHPGAKLSAAEKELLANWAKGL